MSCHVCAVLTAVPLSAQGRSLGRRPCVCGGLETALQPTESQRVADSGSRGDLKIHPELEPPQQGSQGGLCRGVSLPCIWGPCCCCYTHLGPAEPPHRPRAFPLAWDPSRFQQCPPPATMVHPLPPRWLLAALPCLLVQQAFVWRGFLPTPVRRNHSLTEKVNPSSQGSAFQFPSELSAPVLIIDPLALHRLSVP